MLSEQALCQVIGLRPERAVRVSTMAAIGMGRYTLLSMLAASVVVYHAFATRE